MQRNETEYLNSNNSYSKKKKNNQLHKLQLRKNDEYRLKENISTSHRMTKLRKNVNYQAKEKEKNRIRTSQ